MKSHLLLLPAVLLLGACAGDNHTTQQSPAQPERSANTVGSPERARFSGSRTRVFAKNRVYQITRLETASEPRGEWRALGETIRQQGSSISFTELGSGREVSFTSPHQITPTSAMGDRTPPSGGNSEIPGSSGAPVSAPSR